MNRRTLPPGLIGLALLFWGWNAGQMPFAIPMGILYEIHPLIKIRWNFSDVDIRRTASVATVALIGIYTFIAVTGSWLNALSIFFQWLPITVYPIVLLQTYSDSNAINFRSLLLFAKFDPKIAREKRNFNIIYPFFVICVLSASANPGVGWSFYLGLLIISFIPLWQRRSPRFKLIPWLCALILAANLGFVVQAGLRTMHKYTEQQAIAFLSRYYRGQADPFQQSTSLGDLGAIKQSNNIAFRVKSLEEKTVPRLFREAAYNKYQGGLWIATGTEFVGVPSADENKRWQWQDYRGDYDSVIVTDQTIKNKAIAKLPPGSFQLQNLPAKTLEVNQYGAVRLESELKSLQYQVDFNPQLNFDGEPIPADLEVPASEGKILGELVEKYQLKSPNPTQSISNLEGFFLADFRYSLDLLGDGDRPTPLASFLLDQKQGHCEYFATATTLLLRQMGIPARYAVGYSVHDFSKLEQQYVVRDRHAHAWTLVYVDGQWQNLDTTPSNWAEIEDQNAQGFTLFGDVFSWGRLQLKNIFGAIFTPENIQKWWWIILPILLLRLWFSTSGNQENLGRKILKRPFRKQTEKETLNSKFAAIETTLNQLGFTRSPAQPLGQWLRELQQNEVTAVIVKDLDQLLLWYYGDRFDPHGLSPQEKQALEQGIQGWLEQQERGNFSGKGD